MDAGAVMGGTYNEFRTVSNCITFFILNAKAVKRLENDQHTTYMHKQSKAVPLHAMAGLGGRGYVALTHSCTRH
jgi:hypothetical protein